MKQLLILAFLLLSTGESFSADSTKNTSASKTSPEEVKKLLKEAISKSDKCEAKSDGLPYQRIKKVINDFAVKNGEEILIDPRVKARVRLYGKQLEDLKISDLHTIINLHGYAMVKIDGLYVVMPQVNVKQNNVKVYTGVEKDIYDAEIVTALIEVHNIPAAQLVPILRPLVPQQGHLAAYAPNNRIILTDTFGNAKRLIEIIKLLDVKGDFVVRDQDDE